MPVLHIRALPQRDPTRITAAMTATCVAIAEVYGCPPRQVWATWETIEPGCYVEGQVAAEVQPPDSHPPIATLTCFEGRGPEEIERLLTTAATTLGKALGMPGNIFMEYREARSGRVIAGDGALRNA